VRPFFFGRSDAPIFGLYHEPEGKGLDRGGVVICPPFGAEYVRAHRALRELAFRLASAGFHVLRFDYFGTGDSGGEADQVTIDAWLVDVGAAVDEMLEICGRRSTSLVGLRLGGALAAVAAAGRSDVVRLALWDPVLNGPCYLEELLGRHARFIATHAHPAGYLLPDPPDEALGAPLTPALLDGLRAIDLLATARPAPEVMVVHSGADPLEYQSLCSRLEVLGATTKIEHHPGPKVWLKEEQITRALVPPATLDSIVAWLSS
jgi:pimeloyl-ACP methyl ester carboxylesterase